MRIKVTRKDIEDGGIDVGSTCGCPIWHALNRQLNLGDDPHRGAILRLPSVRIARIGKLKFRLPLKAQKWQLAGMHGEILRPIQFDLGKITITRR